MQKAAWFSHGLAGVLGAAGAFAVMAWMQRGGPPTEAAQTPGTTAPVPGEPVHVVAMSPEALRALVREELARHDAVVRPAARGEPLETAPPSPASLAHAERAQSVVESAAARRRWTDDDARALRAEMGSLTQDQRADLLRRFATAVNEGGMKIETAGPPL